MDKLVKNIIYVFSADIGVKFLGMFTSFFVAKLLAPADYGVWITLSLIVSYSGFLHLGTASALMKEGPYYIGQKNLKRLSEIEKGVMAWLSIVGLLIVLSALTLHLFVSAESVGKEFFLLRIVLIATLIDLICVFNHVRFAIHQDFQYAGTMDSVGGVLRLALYVGLSYHFGLYGTVYALLLCDIVLCLLSSRISIREYGRFGVKYDYRLIWSLMKVGFPLMIINFIFILLTSADRWVSISMLGRVATGYYGLGGSMVAMIVMLPYAINRVLFPKLNERMGATSDQTTLLPLIIAPGRAFSLILPFLLGLVALLCPFIFLVLLPKYAPGLLSAQILILGCFFVCIMRNGANFLIATNRQLVLMKYVIFGLVINVLGNIGLVKIGYGIEGIALCTAVSEFIVCTLIWRFIFASLGCRASEQWKEVALLYLPYGILLAFFFAFSLLFSSFGANPTVMGLLHAGLLAVTTIVLLLSFQVYRQWIREIYALFRRKAMPGA